MNARDFKEISRIELPRVRAQLRTIIDHFEGSIPKSELKFILQNWNADEHQLALDALLFNVAQDRLPIRGDLYDQICELWDRIDVAGLLEEDYTDPRAAGFQSLVRP